MKLNSKDLAYAAILAMALEQQDELGQQFVKDGNRVKSARTDYKESAKVFGKVACAYEVRLNGTPTGWPSRNSPPNLRPVTNSQPRASHSGSERRQCDFSISDFKARPRFGFQLFIL